jgi:hypothetical protein
LRRPENFQKVQTDEFGHGVFWIDADGEEIDLSADSLRRDAVLQEERHRLIAG